jgi:hypothetical protein
MSSGQWAKQGVSLEAWAPCKAGGTYTFQKELYKLFQKRHVRLWYPGTESGLHRARGTSPFALKEVWVLGGQQALVLICHISVSGVFSI